MRICGLLLSIALLPSMAQTTALSRSVPATRDGSVSVRPDAARVTISVISRRQPRRMPPRKIQRCATVIFAVRSFGPNADVRIELGYNPSPIYSSQQQLTGFSTLNTIEAR